MFLRYSILTAQFANEKQLCRLSFSMVYWVVYMYMDRSWHKLLLNWFLLNVFLLHYITANMFYLKCYLDPLLACFLCFLYS